MSYQSDSEERWRNYCSVRLCMTDAEMEGILPALLLTLAVCVCVLVVASCFSSGPVVGMVL